MVCNCSKTLTVCKVLALDAPTTNVSTLGYDCSRATQLIKNDIHGHAAGIYYSIQKLYSAIALLDPDLFRC